MDILLTQTAQDVLKSSKVFSGYSEKCPETS